MKNNFWKNKKVFITGHTGFKGSWLVLILNQLGAKITGYALNPISKPNFFDNLKLSRFLEKEYRDDINNFSNLNKAIKKSKPNIVFHLPHQSSTIARKISEIIKKPDIKNKILAYGNGNSSKKIIKLILKNYSEEKLKRKKFVI